LDAGIVDDLSRSDYFVQALVPGISGSEVGVRDLEFVWSHEVQGNIRKVPQEGGERVHCATVPEIPHERDGYLLGLQREVPIDGIGIEKRLGGMFPCTITRVYDRNSRMGSNLCCISLIAGPDSDDISISSDDFGGVFQSFTLGDTGELHPCFRDDFPAESEHGSLKRESGTCGRFIEERCHDAVLGNSGTADFDDVFHDPCSLKDMVQEGSVELVGGENVAEHRGEEVIEGYEKDYRKVSYRGIFIQGRSRIFSG